ncbi:hypothetical protein NEMBOFW57_003393 [Staphylotrichum longicolle]|uniref:GRF-type domain-containing protein n=1 Tax=Staphylotrichum longicolle TaxID=669026 RepID=A0AAD4F636_9PEZI|nr:hypothetical protein NEMBOFW57_003393 [Staphylotrichum longicolle]
MSPSTPPKSSPPQRWHNSPGKYEDGKWYCACDPPQQAAFLQVKKEGANKGRWFYTCPKPREAQCRFFLFEDAARALQKKTLEQKSAFSKQTTALANDSPGMSDKPGPGNFNREANRAETPQSEVASTVAGGPMFSPTSSVFPTPAPSGRIFGKVGRVPNPFWISDEDSDDTAGPEYPTVSTRTRRKRTRADDEAEATARDRGNGRTGPDNLSEFDSDDDAQLAELADQAAERIHQPQRAQFSDSVATPSGRGLGAARAGWGGLPTPDSGNSFLGTSEPGAKRFKTAQGPQATPTPARTRNALAAGGDLSQGDCCSEDDAEITIAALACSRRSPSRRPCGGRCARR